MILTVADLGHGGAVDVTRTTSCRVVGKEPGRGRRAWRARGVVSEMGSSAMSQAPATDQKTEFEIKTDREPAEIVHPA